MSKFWQFLLVKSLSWQILVANQSCPWSSALTLIGGHSPCDGQPFTDLLHLLSFSSNPPVRGHRPVVCILLLLRVPICLMMDSTLL